MWKIVETHSRCECPFCGREVLAKVIHSENNMAPAQVTLQLPPPSGSIGCKALLAAPRTTEAEQPAEKGIGRPCSGGGNGAGESMCLISGKHEWGKRRCIMCGEAYPGE